MRRGREGGKSEGWEMEGRRNSVVVSHQEVG